MPTRNEAVALTEKLNSGEEVSRLRKQRDILWLFAQDCYRWSQNPTRCRCGQHAEQAMESAGLKSEYGKAHKESCAVNPRLALQMIMRMEDDGDENGN